MARIKAEIIHERMKTRSASENSVSGELSTDRMISRQAIQHWTVGCDKPDNIKSLEPDDLEVITEFVSEWCDAGNKVWPSMGVNSNWADARVAICNYGWFNPCSREEIDNAWKTIDDVCDKKDGKPATGWWYEGDRLKAYERSQCSQRKVCGRSMVDCSNTEGIDSVPIQI
ncbi:hypothetical protein BKA67DRAFT_534155 [Truncatella angustata]|uniref:Uncharacterized protein n=1 Tax=Truncatella angustata TaxID=152316 RepID=A0A9P8ZYN8_9PEZI|nr:uncharacterized protein BKA67DRAFT_534155 [Truncatella angustata]KAH6655223.1 hypothetical protein BKA67DRAFT_534155 [Truncatella angustata]